jgi:hypothetical protein
MDRYSVKENTGLSTSPQAGRRPEKLYPAAAENLPRPQLALL